VVRRQRFCVVQLHVFGAEPLPAIRWSRRGTMGAADRAADAAGGRPAGSALYFMMTPAAPVKLHRIRNDQLYHYYLGVSLLIYVSPT
jgi:predicted cupin superfamily sugar epimerase